MSRYCENIRVKLIFTTTKIKDSFSCKDKLDSFTQKASVIYKFTCAGCNSSYIGETERHLSVRAKEHFKDQNSHIYKHLIDSPRCKEMCNLECFSVLDYASTKYQLRLKEGLHIKWEKPILNRQVKHYIMSLNV